MPSRSSRVSSFSVLAPSLVNARRNAVTLSASRSSGSLRKPSALGRNSAGSACNHSPCNWLRRKSLRSWRGNQAPSSPSSWTCSSPCTLPRPGSGQACGACTSSAAEPPPSSTRRGSSQSLPGARRIVQSACRRRACGASGRRCASGNQRLSQTTRPRVSGRPGASRRPCQRPSPSDGASWLSSVSSACRSSCARVRRRQPVGSSKSWASSWACCASCCRRSCAASGNSAPDGRPMSSPPSCSQRPAGQGRSRWKRSRWICSGSQARVSRRDVQSSAAESSSELAAAGCQASATCSTRRPGRRGRQPDSPGQRSSACSTSSRRLAPSAPRRSSASRRSPMPSADRPRPCHSRRSTPCSCNRLRQACQP